MPFLRRQFDKLLCLGVIVFFSVLLMHLHGDTESTAIRELVQFFREITAGVVGAFLSLIQGQHRERETEQPPEPKP